MIVFVKSCVLLKKILHLYRINIIYIIYIIYLCKIMSAKFKEISLSYDISLNINEVYYTAVKNVLQHKPCFFISSAMSLATAFAPVSVKCVISVLPVEHI